MDADKVELLTSFLAESYEDNIKEASSTTSLMAGCMGEGSGWPRSASKSHKNTTDLRAIAASARFGHVPGTESSETLDFCTAMQQVIFAR